jgi:hypothetical protein
MGATPRLLFLGLAALIAGCASGPKYADVQSAIPAPDPAQGRLYFFREASGLGAAVQPAILLNGEKVGDSVPGGFFFVDRVPGEYVASASTEVERRVTVSLRAGATEYLRTRVTFGALVGHVQVELATPSMFEAVAHELSYTGAPLAPAAPLPAEAYAGTWSGKWGTSIEHTLVVEGVEGRTAALVYSWSGAAQGAASGSTRATGEIDAHGALRTTLRNGAQVSYRLSADRSRLSGEYLLDGRTTRGAFTRR